MYLLHDESTCNSNSIIKTSFKAKENPKSSIKRNLNALYYLQSSDKKCSRDFNFCEFIFWRHLFKIANSLPCEFKVFTNKELL